LPGGIGADETEILNRVLISAGRRTPEPITTSSHEPNSPSLDSADFTDYFNAPDKPVANQNKATTEEFQQIRRQSTDQLFSIIFDTMRAVYKGPQQNTAIVLCWVNADTLAEARKVAQQEIAAEGYLITRMEEYNIVECGSDKYGQGDYNDEEIDEILGNVAAAQRDGFYARYIFYPTE
jgi:hypothetical protein